MLNQSWGIEMHITCLRCTYVTPIGQSSRIARPAGCPWYSLVDRVPRISLNMCINALTLERIKHVSRSACLPYAGDQESTADAGTMLPQWIDNDGGAVFEGTRPVCRPWTRTPLQPLSGSSLTIVPDRTGGLDIKWDRAHGPFECVMLRARLVGAFGAAFLLATTAVYSFVAFMSDGYSTFACDDTYNATEDPWAMASHSDNARFIDSEHLMAASPAGVAPNPEAASWSSGSVYAYAPSPALSAWYDCIDDASYKSDPFGAMPFFWAMFLAQLVLASFVKGQRDTLHITLWPSGFRMGRVGEVTWPRTYKGLEAAGRWLLAEMGGANDTDVEVHEPILAAKVRFFY